MSSHHRVVPTLGGNSLGIDLGIEQGNFFGKKVCKLAQNCGESRSGRRHGALEMGQIPPEKKGAG